MRNHLESKRKCFIVVGNRKEHIPLNIKCILTGYERIHETVETILHK